jgi:2-polyprenyl-3-methyl-5-hydroxy-6-metoxy-1,4-benzoquinol methylase
MTVQTEFKDLLEKNEIRSRSCPSCCICGATGEPLYDGLTDRLFGAPGVWNFKRCSKPSCGLLWLDPMPVEEDIALAYKHYLTHQEGSQPANTFLRRVYNLLKADYISIKYGYQGQRRSMVSWIISRLAWLHPVRRDGFDFNASYLSWKPDGRLLDVGCGRGELLERMQRLGWNVEGVDFDHKAVKGARQKRLRVHHGTLAAQSYRDQTFDAITMVHLIEHIHDPVALLRECHRVLRPGGRLVVVTPNAFSWGHRLYGSDWRGLEPPRHLNIFTPVSLAAAAGQAGFRQAQCRTTARAAVILLESRYLQRTGNVESVPRRALSTLVWIEAMGLIEWLRSQVEPHAGEETILIATK